MSQIPSPDIGAYTISKAALNYLVGTLGSVAGVHNVRVNGIMPGTIDTEFATVLTKGPVNLKKGSMLGRFGTPEDCAGVALFLCSSDASYVSGEMVKVCGGLTYGNIPGVLGSKPQSKL